MINVLVNNEFEFRVREHVLVDITTKILADHQIRSGEISIAVVDDPTMQALNRTYLQHDYPTDVLSFVFEQRAAQLDGEIIVSYETAERTAREYDWSPSDELTLYVIHGCLHLVGYHDHVDADRLVMRGREAHYLDQIGIASPEGHRQRVRRDQGASA